MQPLKLAFSAAVSGPRPEISAPCAFSSSTQIPVAIPPELGGSAHHATPEELLAGALASCYAATLSMLFQKRRIDATILQVRVEGTVARDDRGAFQLGPLTITPSIEFPESPSLRDTIAGLIQRAEQYCLISQAIHGNIPVVIEPDYRSYPPQGQQ